MAEATASTEPLTTVQPGGRGKRVGPKRLNEPQFLNDPVQMHLRGIVQRKIAQMKAPHESVNGALTRFAQIEVARTPRTVERWLAGDARIPWSAVQKFEPVDSE